MPKTSTRIEFSSEQNGSPGLDDHVGHWLRRAHHFAASNLSKHIRDHALTPAQLATLLRLHEVKHASQNELGRLVAMEPANIHKIVNRLLGQGFVLVKKDRSDARKNIIHLSTKGQRLVEELEPLHWSATQDTLSVLTAAEQRQLMSLLKRLCRMGSRDCG